MHEINAYSSGADPGGSLGSRDPPPEIYQRSQKSDVLALFLEISVILALYNKTTYIFQGVAPTTPHATHPTPYLALYLLKYALYLIISMILVL